MPTVQTLLTAEEYARLPDDDVPTELVRGRIVKLSRPRPRHGQVCVKIVRIVGGFIDLCDLGHLVCNDTGIITERDPDTVRGADVAFFSYDRVPRGPLPDDRYLDVAPDAAFEVRSPGDRWSKILAKVDEYLAAGVRVVCVLDPVRRRIHVYRRNQQPRILSANDDLELPDILPGFRAPVRRFFE